jgi:ElaA protein
MVSVSRCTPYDEAVEMIFKTATFADLDALTLYRLLRLRMDVFVVEQECAFPDIDGRDTEPTTRHLWFEQAHEPLVYLRIVEDGAVARIGRVVTAKTARGNGLAGELLTAALVAIGPRPVALDAQQHLTGFYARYGFAVNGPEYLDDGIPHVPMLRQTAR